MYIYSSHPQLSEIELIFIVIILILTMMYGKPHTLKEHDLNDIILVIKNAPTPTQI